MAKNINVSIIIPVYNAQEWMGPTIERLEKAIEKSHFTTEIIVVDDGSKDETLARVRAIRPKSDRVKIEIVAQENKGRYLARKAGIAKAKYDLVLFIDSRIFIYEDSLAYLERKLATDLNQVWNAHVNVDKAGNPFARFWDAIVCIAWRKYFANPRETSYGLKDFDYFPKGTTCFFVPKQLFQDALDNFEKLHGQPDKFSNDDTVLIRYMAERQPINISPEFACLYHGRSTFKTFLKHAYHRGQVFTDGFLKPGNRFFFPLLAFLSLTVAVLITLILAPVLALELLAAALVLGVAALFFGALVLKVVWQDAASLAGLAPLFAVVYGSGIWRAVFRKIGLWK